jgi:hypothetical protein
MFTLFSDNVTDAFAMKKFTKARNDRQFDRIATRCRCAMVYAIHKNVR